MLASDSFGSAVPAQIATVVVPVGVYFLILGLLNSRKNPQLLSGRQDFAVLIVALCPLFALPVLNYVGITWVSVLIAVGAIAAGVYLLAPRAGNWVVYNLPLRQARPLVRGVLEAMGTRPVGRREGFYLPDRDALVEVGGFPLLRNVTVRLKGGRDDLARRLENRLQRRLRDVPAETSPSAVGLMLVATAMLVAPFALVAHRVPEIVRVLTDLLK